MKYFLLGSVKHFGKALLYGIVGGFIVLVTVFVLYLESRPDLKIWHEVKLDAEFTAESFVQSFEDYPAIPDWSQNALK